MNAYQQKWIEVLNNSHIPGWEINAQEDDIYIEMPNVTDLKLIRDNLPETLGLISLDIDEQKERLKFVFNNGHEHFEYVLNPGNGELTSAG